MMTGYWMPAARCWPRNVNTLLLGVISRPPWVTPTAMPPNVRALASVARNAFTCSFVTSSPLMRPITKPEKIATGNAHHLAQNEDRPEREVEVTGDDREGDGARGDADGRVLEDEVEEVLRGEEYGRGDREVDEERDEKGDDAVV